MPQRLLATLVWKIDVATIQMELKGTSYLILKHNICIHNFEIHDIDGNTNKVWWLFNVEHLAK